MTMAHTKQIQNINVQNLPVRQAGSQQLLQPVSVIDYLVIENCLGFVISRLWFLIGAKSMYLESCQLFDK
jgi:hypothetical protein